MVLQKLKKTQKKSEQQRATERKTHKKNNETDLINGATGQCDFFFFLSFFFWTIDRFKPKF